VVLDVVVVVADEISISQHRQSKRILEGSEYLQIIFWFHLWFVLSVFYLFRWVSWDLKLREFHTFPHSLAKSPQICVNQIANKSRHIVLPALPYKPQLVGRQSSPFQSTQALDLPHPFLLFPLLKSACLPLPTWLPLWPLWLLPMRGTCPIGFHWYRPAVV